MAPTAAFFDYTQITADQCDLIEIQRELYCHWVLVYSTGQGQCGSRIVVAHFCDDGVTRVQPLAEIAKNCKCRVNNMMGESGNRKLQKQTNGEVIARVDRDLKEVLVYNLVTNNCEIMATKWRYGGNGFSAQVVLGKKVVGASVAVTALGSSFVMSGVALADNRDQRKKNKNY